MIVDRVLKPQSQIIQNVHDKDRTTDNEAQQRCESTPITAEQYLRDQLFKDITVDTLTDILKQIEDINLTVT